MNEISKEQLNEHHRSVPPNYYDQGIKKNIFQRIWHKGRTNILPEVLTGVGSRVLDIGCHGGYFTNEIAKRIGDDILGLDISENAIEYARNKYPKLKFEATDVENKIDLENNYFDAVTAFDVVEHIPNLDFVAKEINRVLKPGGVFIVGIPRENILFKVVWYVWTKSKGKVWHDVHVHEFSEEKLKKFFEENGFKKMFDKKIHLGMYWVIKYQKISGHE
ncbi:class I SAM-dependent methyltransferase [Patescibacteria group bacterium]|nr:class I SAM-dependent methyltransferase [Patescibacteria group bacterium]